MATWAERLKVEHKGNGELDNYFQSRYFQRDFRHSLYWLAVAVLTTTVTF